MYRCTSSPVWTRKKPGKHEHCKFPHRTCSYPTLDNYDYCIKHILEDKSAPFKSCGYVYPINGKKCNQPAPKLLDRKEGGFCAEHARKAQVMRQRASGRHCPPQTVESLLASLAHYAPNNSLCKPGNDMEIDDDSCTQTINPFVEMDAKKVNLSGSRVLDYVSESDSDVEPATLDSVWRDYNRDSSDAESVDSQQEDPLKHAGVYTAEEATLIIKEKMLRLQSLYYDQFKRLQHVLKERKRKYYHALMKEKEAISKNNMTTIREQSKTSPKEMKLYEKLKALNQFHKRTGEEGILYMRVKDKQNQSKKMKKFRYKSRLLDGKHEGLFGSSPFTSKCVFTEGGVKCGLKALPSSKNCRKHILEDSNQKLFRPCGCEKADILCQEPVLNIFDDASCPLHVSLPVLPHFNVEQEVKEEKGGGDIKAEINIEMSTNEVILKEGPPNIGPGGDIRQLQNQADNIHVPSSKKSTSLTVKEEHVNIDDIMVNVDVVEEVVCENEKESKTDTEQMDCIRSDHSYDSSADNFTLQLDDSNEVSNSDNLIEKNEIQKEQSDVKKKPGYVKTEFEQTTVQTEKPENQIEQRDERIEEINVIEPDKISINNSDSDKNNCESVHLANDLKNNDIDRDNSKISEEQKSV